MNNEKLMVKILQVVSNGVIVITMVILLLTVVIDVIIEPYEISLHSISSLFSDQSNKRNFEELEPFSYKATVESEFSKEALEIQLETFADQLSDYCTKILSYNKTDIKSIDEKMSDATYSSMAFPLDIPDYENVMYSIEIDKYNLLKHLSEIGSLDKSELVGFMLGNDIIETKIRFERKIVTNSDLVYYDVRGDEIESWIYYLPEDYGRADVFTNSIRLQNNRKTVYKIFNYTDEDKQTISLTVEYLDDTLIIPGYLDDFHSDEVRKIIRTYKPLPAFLFNFYE